VQNVDDDIIDQNQETQMFFSEVDMNSENIEFGKLAGPQYYFSVMIIFLRYSVFKRIKNTITFRVKGLRTT
jgi:hypothetical protein